MTIPGPDLIVFVPTRSRPEAVAKVVEAWQETDAFAVAEPLFIFDHDDPRAPEYVAAFEALGPVAHHIRYRSIPTWRPLVPKLDSVAVDYAKYSPEVFALGFAGDDHLPRTRGWAQAYIAELHRLGTGMVYGDDGHQHENLPTQWAMTADIVRALGRMVPAPVDHLYCDNSVRDLGQAADCLSYLPEVLIEHMHPVAGKAPTDEQYERVNGAQQYRGDRRAYREWQRRGLTADAQTITRLRERS